ncbi:MAG TPA: chromosomal replication initiator protein DnaA [Fusobacteria bacterium]|nr:chromosomal replication initiator protein DnaA [Fusobacteriota bacterium]|tara:strand:+ start:2344 stop:3681 length:1338 start_codon:yes stop_codon:yes gene_type:complete
MQANRAWESIKKNLELKLSKSEFKTWFSSASPMSFEDDKLVIAVDNEFTKEKINKEYRDAIKESIRELFIDGDGKDVEVVVSPNKKLNEERLVETRERGFNANTKKNNLPDSKYNFSNFIVGKSNEFAHAASRAVAISPGKVYNPLFIYGGVGLGKTHLMHSIGNYITSQNPEAKVYYCSSEQFTNDLINSLKKDRMAQFREKYRKLDALLIDDIQFIAGKESTQEEFFHTFNSLHQYSRQIVVSSDRPPQEIKNIEERLVSRFTWGLVADIKAPDYETRVAILKNKAEAEGITIPEDAINYIAEAIKSNIRELEGSLNRVVAKASLLGRDVDFDMIKEVFKGFMEDRAKKINKGKIIKTVSEFFGVPISDIESNKRKKEIAKARQISMYLLRDMLNLPFSSIGDSFGGRDHTTVMHSVNKIDSEVAFDKSLKFEIDQIRQNILK